MKKPKELKKKKYIFLSVYLPPFKAPSYQKTTLYYCETLI